jgi:hypothetical protein
MDILKLFKTLISIEICLEKRCLSMQTVEIRELQSRE